MIRAGPSWSRGSIHPSAATKLSCDPLPSTAPIGHCADSVTREVGQRAIAQLYVRCSAYLVEFPRHVSAFCLCVLWSVLFSPIKQQAFSVCRADSHGGKGPSSMHGDIGSLGNISSKNSNKRSSNNKSSSGKSNNNSSSVTTAEYPATTEQHCSTRSCC